MVLCLGPLIHPLPPIQRKEVRELERCAQKLAKSGCSLLFNGPGLNENILPKYSKYYVHAFFISNAQIQMLLREIQNSLKLVLTYLTKRCLKYYLGRVQ